MVIPKEIRRTMRIREGDPLEISTNSEGGVIFKKYSPHGRAGRFCRTDVRDPQQDHRTYFGHHRPGHLSGRGRGGKRDLMDKRISSALEQIMEGRGIYQYQNGETPYCSDRGQPPLFRGLRRNISLRGDVLGCVIALPEMREELLTDETDYKNWFRPSQDFLGRHMEG